MANESRLEGHDAIREYIDPRMSRSYYFKHIAPLIKPILFRRSYRQLPKKARDSGEPRTIYWTYTNLVQEFLLRVGKV